jgi:hypothetical protein
MSADIPLRNGYFEPTPYVLSASREADEVTVTIDAGFAGRTVEESFAFEDFRRLGGEEPFDFEDVLGLVLRTDGQTITGLIGVGSGNERFAVSREDWNTALLALEPQG